MATVKRLCTNQAPPRKRILVKNIVSKLTKYNKHEKALLRYDDSSWVYIWICKFKVSQFKLWGYRKDKTGYIVQVTLRTKDKEKEKSYEREFWSLPKALKYANGEDDGLVSTLKLEPQSHHHGLIDGEYIRHESVFGGSKGVIMMKGIRP